MAKLSKYDVKNWIETVASGEFHYKDALDGRVDPLSYGHLRKIMHELCVEEVCETIGRRDGFYRPIENGVRPVDFKNLRQRDYPVKLPFDLLNYFRFYPDTVGVVAGSKSSGKTGFIFRTIKLNFGKIKMKLLSNLEGGREMIYDRFLAMDIDLAKEEQFIYPVHDNYHDYIKDNDTFYLIDYIDAPDGTDFYLIGAMVKKIDKKLQGLNSVALIGLQKPFGRDTAFGGEQTLKNPTFYLAMDSNKLKVLDAKVPANKNFHPKNMQWTFKYDEAGTNFWDIKRSYEVD